MAVEEVAGVDPHSWTTTLSGVLGKETVVLVDNVAVAGIGRTTYSRNSGRTTKAMAAEACRDALADAGLSFSDVDGMANFSAGDSTTSLAVAHAIGIDELEWCVDLFGGGNACCSAIAAAAAAVSTGQCQVAVVYRSLNGRSGHRFGTATGRFDVPGDMQFTGPQGYLVPPQWMAMWARRHQAVYGTTCEDLGHIAITERMHASANRHAIKRDPITMDEYLEARWINEPLRLHDCAIEVDGAAAVVLTRLDRARDLARPPVRLTASVDSHSHGGSWEEWPDMTQMFSARAAARLWKATGLDPADIDVACIYDCFTYTVMCVLEDFGFFEKGGAGAYFAEGRATYGGDVVVNPHGGLLSEGYIHGMNHHFEAVVQLRGEGGERQVASAETALVTGGAGPYGGALIYTVDR